MDTKKKDFSIIIDGEKYLYNKNILCHNSKVISAGCKNFNITEYKIDSKDLNISKKNIILGLKKLHKTIEINKIPKILNILILYEYLQIDISFYLDIEILITDLNENNNNIISLLKHINKYHSLYSLYINNISFRKHILFIIDSIYEEEYGFDKKVDELFMIFVFKYGMVEDFADRVICVCKYSDWGSELSKKYNIPETKDVKCYIQDKYINIIRLEPDSNYNLLYNALCEEMQEIETHRLKIKLL